MSTALESAVAKLQSESGREREAAVEKYRELARLLADGIDLTQKQFDALGKTLKFLELSDQNLKDDVATLRSWDAQKKMCVDGYNIQVSLTAENKEIMKKVEEMELAVKQLMLKHDQNEGKRIGISMAHGESLKIERRNPRLFGAFAKPQPKPAAKQMQAKGIEFDESARREMEQAREANRGPAPNPSNEINFG